MKRIVISVIIGIALLYCLQASGILSALMLFILVGAIPGSDISLSPSMMLAFLTAAALAMIMQTIAPTIYSLALKFTTARQTSAQKHTTPKRRFSDI